MSWTIETNNDQAAGMKKLSQAIDKAYKRNIVMICSASDQGSASKVTCYPGKWGKCIRIGASTGTGEKCAWVHGEDVDFIFPGENVPFDRSNEMPPTYHSGSSVATAIAAGTASLLLYCNKLVALANGGSKNSNDLKSMSAMTNAFETMSIASNNNCPRVGHFFDKRFSNLKWVLDRNKSLDILASIMKKIKVGILWQFEML
jgi:Subtilase family